MQTSNTLLSMKNPDVPSKHEYVPCEIGIRALFVFDTLNCRYSFDVLFITYSILVEMV